MRRGKGVPTDLHIAGDVAGAAKSSVGYDEKAVVAIDSSRYRTPLPELHLLVIHFPNDLFIESI